MFLEINLCNDPSSNSNSNCSSNNKSSRGKGSSGKWSGKAAMSRTRQKFDHCSLALELREGLSKIKLSSFRHFNTSRSNSKFRLS